MSNILHSVTASNLKASKASFENIVNAMVLNIDSIIEIGIKSRYNITNE